VFCHYLWHDFWQIHCQVLQRDIYMNAETATQALTVDSAGRIVLPSGKASEAAAAVRAERDRLGGRQAKRG